VPRRTDWASYLAQFHADRPGITEQAFRHAIHPEIGTPYAWLTAALPNPPGAVLDIACGNAAVLPWLTGHDRYLGVDSSPAEIAQARAQQRGPVTLGDASSLPVPDTSVDTVVSSMGLMLVRPIQAAVAELARVLRPGGTVVLLLPAIWPVLPRDLALGAALALPLPGPGSMPTQVGPRRIRRLLGDTGLTVADLSRRRFPFPLATAEHAALAVRSLYTPGRTTDQVRRAEHALARHARPGAELPVPLMRVVARRG
jgi:SAM-dependent methyltransferase